MLPPSLQSIYQQYNNDTAVVASWLATTAKSHGYADPSASAPSVRLTGKARKQAKAAQQHQEKQPELLPNANAEQSTGPKRVLATRDFVFMAEYIAGKGKSVKVPTFFSHALERVIWVRKSFSGKLISAGWDLDAGSVVRHTFFVGILEQVRDALKPLLVADAFDLSDLKNAAQGIGASVPDEATRNLFEPLHLYEPSEEFLAAPDAAAPPRPDISLDYTAEPEESVFEAVFAFTAFLLDLARLRDEIDMLWTSYLNGDLDLAAVSVATNTALELARAMEEDINHLIDSENGPQYFLQVFFHSLCENTSTPVSDRREGEDFNYEVYDLGNKLFFNTLFMLDAYVRGNSGYPGPYNGSRGWYNETPQNGLSNAEKWEQDKTAMLELLPDAALLATFTGPVEDELL